MKVKCALCDKIETLDDQSLQAKRLRNRPIHTYMCEDCNKRITEKTKERFANSQYRIYHRMRKKENEW